MSPEHETFMRALESRSYEALWINRYESRCWLIIRLNGKEHCFVNQFGKSPEYHHAWQIRQWLSEHFGIAADNVPVRLLRR